MTENEFARQTQAAVERMREMNSRSKVSENSHHKMPPSPSFVKVNHNNTPTPKNTSKKQETNETNHSNPPPPKKDNTGFNIPLLDNLLKDGDTALILGLLLVLMSENTDKMLLFALIYILM